MWKIFSNVENFKCGKFFQIQMWKISNVENFFKFKCGNFQMWKIFSTFGTSFNQLCKIMLDQRIVMRKFLVILTTNDIKKFHNSHKIQMWKIHCSVNKNNKLNFAAMELRHAYDPAN